MNTSQPAAAMRAGAHDTPRARPRDARTAADDAVAEESLPAHARRALRHCLSAAAIAVLDAGVALLQRLRKAAGGKESTFEQTEDDRPRSRNERPGRGREQVRSGEDAETPAPEPRRRVRAYLIYLTLLVTGVMAGTALAYNLLGIVLDRQAVETRRMETKILKYSKATAAIEHKLGLAESKRVEAEKRLAAAVAETAKSLADKQKKIDDAENRLRAMPGPERTRYAQAQVPPPVGRDSAPHRVPQVRSGKCTVDEGNVADLKKCINGYYR